ncbi:MAG: hypothetical protein N2112_07255 [Gemmataceae bacterium]|jgi:hypothetical protein|nr:hypothetical protein [Gemmataceae bacterium]
MLFLWVITAVLILIALITGSNALLLLRHIRFGPALASTERAYLRNKGYRRLLNAGFMLLLAGMFAGGSLFGLHSEFERIMPRDRIIPIEDRPEADKVFLKWWAIYWISVLATVAVIAFIALLDLLATNHYANAEIRRLREENRAILERDLALHKVSQNQQRTGFGGRLGSQ